MADEVELMKTGIEAVTSSAIKPVADLISSIFGPAAEEAGLMLKDHVRVFRAQRQLRLYQQTATIVEKMGIKPQRVPLKLLFPIVENASFEESDELQDRWANLLAHAADPVEADTVSISFPTILRELSPRQVKFLDALYESALKDGALHGKPGVTNKEFGYVDFISTFTDADLSRYPARQHFSVVERERDDVRADESERGVALDMFVRHRIMEEAYEIPRRPNNSPNWQPELDSSFRFTLLGGQFIAACREPKKKSVVIESPG